MREGRRKNERRQMNGKGASRLSHTKTTRVGRTRRRSSWWRLAGKRIAGRSRSPCIMDEARALLGPLPAPSPCPLLPAPLPRACVPSVGAGAAARGARSHSSANTIGRSRRAPRAADAENSAWQPQCRSLRCRSTRDSGAAEAASARLPGALGSRRTACRALTPGRGNPGIPFREALCPTQIGGGGGGMLGHPAPASSRSFHYSSILSMHPSI